MMVTAYSLHEYFFSIQNKDISMAFQQLEQYRNWEREEGMKGNERNTLKRGDLEKHFPPTWPLLFLKVYFQRKLWWY